MNSRTSGVLAFFTCVMIAPCSVDASCVDFASNEFRLDARIIYSIIKTQSNFNSKAININTNKSWDIGLMQINTIHQDELREHGMKLSDLLVPCKNIIVGSWLLRRHIDAANGNVWQGVGDYHSLTPELSFQYALKVKSVYNKLGDVFLLSEMRHKW